MLFFVADVGDGFIPVNDKNIKQALKGQKAVVKEQIQNLMEDFTIAKDGQP